MKAKVELVSSNAKPIDEFLSSLPVLSPRRVKKYRLSLIKVSRDLGPFEDVKQSDLKAYNESTPLVKLMPTLLKHSKAAVDSAVDASKMAKSIALGRF